MSSTFYNDLSLELDEIRQSGLYKSERLISGEQDASIEVNGKEVLNFCANNYLGLADSPELIAAAKAALDNYGFGMASVRFICGTQSQHRELEQSLASWLGFKMPLSRMRLITPPSSMVFGSARPNAIAMRIMTWRRWSKVSRTQKTPARAVS